MGDSKAPVLRDRKPPKKAAKKRPVGRPRKPPSQKQDDSTAGRKERRDQARFRKRTLPTAVTAPPDAPRIPQPNGGALLAGGVPGNRGGYVAAARRHLRKQLLKAVIEGGGLEFLRDVIKGDIKRTHVRPNGETKKVDDEKFRKETIETALKYGLGEISSHALVNENDETLETGVIELPMMDAAPAPPPHAGEVAPAPSLTKAARAKALDAAAALIEAAK